jgi:hypothetical protein
MFLLASSQTNARPEQCNRIAGGLPKQRNAAASIGYVKWVVWRLSVTLRDYDRNFMEVSGFDL